MKSRNKPLIINRIWVRFWMSLAGLNGLGKIGTYFASLLAPPHKARTALATFNRRGFIDPNATIYHSDLIIGDNVFIADRVLLYQAR